MNSWIFKIIGTATLGITAAACSPTELNNRSQPLSGKADRGLDNIQAQDDLSCSYIFDVKQNLKEVCYTVEAGFAIAEGDIILGTVQEMAEVREAIDSQKQSFRALISIDNASTYTQHYWTKGLVPYRFREPFPHPEKVIEAMHHIEQNTSVRFVPYNGERSFITFLDGGDKTSGMSRIGRANGEQFIVLPSSLKMRTTVHEIGHALGLYHEHVRRDRDAYIKIHEENIAPGAESAFKPIDTPAFAFGDYDYGSVMHYFYFMFAKTPGLAVITRLDGSTAGIGGEQLSPKDIAGLDQLYKPKTPAPKPAAFPFAEAFGVNNHMGINDYWTTQVGFFEVFAGLNNPFLDLSLASVNGLSAADVKVSAYVSAAAPAARAGLVARYLGPGDKNMYWAGLVRTADGSLQVQLQRNVEGLWTMLGTAAVEDTSHGLTLTLEGRQIKVAVNNTIVISIDDAALSAAGGVGVRGTTSNYLQFQATSLNSNQTPVNPFPWQNPKNNLDVNNDSSVSAADALAIINELNSSGTHELDRAIASPPLFFYDANGDHMISPLDALMVINYLNR